MLHLRRWLQRPSALVSSDGADAVARACAALLLAAVIVQYLFVGLGDPYKCKALLNHGSWPPRDDLAAQRREFDLWEPAGCRMHEYSREQFRDCLGGRRVVVAGDSVTRQVFWAAVRRLDHFRADELIMDTLVSADPQHDISVELEGVKLDFVWDPWLNSSTLSKELARFRGTKPSGSVLRAREDEDSAGLIVLGAPGLWAARNGGEQYFDIFQDAIDGVRPYLKQGIKPAQGQKLSYSDIDNHILLAPVQIPAYEKLSSMRRKILTPAKFDHMNGYLESLAAGERSHVVSVYNEMTVGQAFAENGLHTLEDIAERWITVALNARCNAGLAWQGQANKTTCCTSYAPLITVQKILALIGGLVLIAPVFSRAKEASMETARVPLGAILKALGVIVAILVYCYLADRSHLFAKTEKHYSHSTLLVFLVLSQLAVGASYTPLSRGNNARKTATASTVDQPLRFLPRHITDEWQGCMLIPLLLLQFYETSEVLWVYKFTRLCIGAFVFISTFTHARHFLETEDFSFRRAATVIFRFNALSCLMSLVMNVDWTLYYLPRLLTFWFIFTYVTLRVLKRANGKSVLLFAKLLISGAAVTYLILDPRFIASVGRNVRLVLPIVFDEGQIIHHLSLDKSSAFLGILAASMSHSFSTSPLPSQPAQRRRNTTRLSLPRNLDPDEPSSLLRTAALLLSANLLLLFLLANYLTDRYADRDAYDALHSMLSGAAVLAYAVLRCSALGPPRVYLAAPAALGPSALEAYVLHRHVWLSGDGTGLLRTGLLLPRAAGRGPVSAAAWCLETAVLAAVLLWGGCKVRRATEDVAAWLFGNGGAGSSRTTAKTDHEDQGIEMEELEGGIRYNGNGGVAKGRSGLLDGGVQSLDRGSRRRGRPVAAAAGLAAGLWALNYLY